MVARKPNSGSLGALRFAALLAAPVGALGSLGFLLHASQHPPRVLLVLFVIWVLSPFAGLAFAGVVSRQWPVATRAALYGAMLLVTIASLAFYADDARGHRRAPAAPYLVVPLASWVLIAAVVPTAALIAGTRSRGGDRP